MLLVKLAQTTLHDLLHHPGGLASILQLGVQDLLLVPKLLIGDGTGVQVTWTHGHYVHGHLIRPGGHAFHVQIGIRSVRSFQHHQCRLVPHALSDLVVDVLAHHGSRRMCQQLVPPTPLHVLAYGSLGFGEGVLQIGPVLQVSKGPSLGDVDGTWDGSGRRTCDLPGQLLHGVRPGGEIRLGVDFHECGVPTRSVHVHRHDPFCGVPVRLLPCRHHASLSKLFHGAFGIAMAGLQCCLDLCHGRTAGGTKRTDGFEAHLVGRAGVGVPIQAPSEGVDGSSWHGHHGPSSSHLVLDAGVVSCVGSSANPNRLDVGSEVMDVGRGRFCGWTLGWDMDPHPETGLTHAMDRKRKRRTSIGGVGGWNSNRERMWKGAIGNARRARFHVRSHPPREK
eukprot:scaffold739_cov295-Pavlova_lutheri.AAC.8